MNKKKKVWLLFDGRYTSTPDRAICYESCETLSEARQNAKDYGDDTVVVEADENESNGEISNLKVV